MTKRAEVEAMLSRLGTRLHETNGDYAERYSIIAETCRSYAGPCFCGCHIATVMPSPTPTAPAGGRR